MSDPRERAWGDALPLLAKLSPVSAEGNPRIRFQGREYILIGEATDAAITTPELFEAGECSYAHLFSDGTVRRFGEVIGRVDEIEHTFPRPRHANERARFHRDRSGAVDPHRRADRSIARKMGAISQRDRLLAAAAILAREGLTPRDALALMDNLVAALEANDKTTALDHLAAIFPFAESRAEDMSEATEGTGEEAAKAWAAIEDARKVLRAAGRVP